MSDAHIIQKIANNMSAEGNNNKSCRNEPSVFKKTCEIQLTVSNSVLPTVSFALVWFCVFFRVMYCSKPQFVESCAFLLAICCRFVSCCAFSLDGRLLATGSIDRTVKIWKLTDTSHIMGRQIYFVLCCVYNYVCMCACVSVYTQRCACVYKCVCIHICESEIKETKESHLSFSYSGLHEVDTRCSYFA